MPLPASAPPGSPTGVRQGIAGFLVGNREIWADLLRFIATAVWLPWILIKRPDEPRLWAPMVAIPSLALLAAVATRFELFPRCRRPLIALLDVGLLGYVVWGLGSTTTPTVVFMVTAVIVTTMTTSSWVALLVTIAVIVTYGAVLLAEAAGWLVRAPLAHPGLGPHETTGGRLFAFICVSLSVATAFGFLRLVRRQLERSAEREHELRLAEQAAQQKALALQSQLELAQRMESMGRLAGGVAHDFNNLLTVIHGAFAYGMEEAGERTTLRQALEDGLGASRRAGHLVQQLLAFSRRQPVKPRVLDPRELIVHTRRMLGRIIGEDVVVIADLAVDLGPVRIDPTQLEQALLNLAINARDAMPRGGRLTLSGRNISLSAADCELRPGTRPGPHVEITVSDTGTGMDEETLRRAIEPFFTTKPQGRGTGLGLSTAFGILQQNGGWLELASTLGRGTTARMLLPRSEEAPVPLELEAASKVSGAETVLLVEDEESLRRMARRALERYGYSVLEASSGESALEKARKHGGVIEALVTDLVMPGLGGKPLAEQLRGERPGLRVLFMSGYSTEAIDQAALLADGAQFLAKPFEPEQLVTRVRRLLDGKDC
ncbi:MAG: response regulator [Deltaproteobacteria bacterium]|nr:response regulator [Deltaproteobacteria bacterium]